MNRIIQPRARRCGQIRSRAASVATAITAAALVAIAYAGCAPARAADPRYPDWPCRQIKVPSLSVAAIWAGPPLDDVAGKWQDDAKTADLVARLAARRTPLEEADSMITEFLGHKGGDQQQRAKLLFAGLFDTLNRERSTIMEGIERFSRKERTFADQIRSEAAELRALQSEPDRDQSKIDDLTNRITWDTRIYEDQRKTISFVCEVPQIIEQRLFALSRTIQQSLD